MMEWAGRALIGLPELSLETLEALHAAPADATGRKAVKNLKHRLHGAGVSEQMIGNNRSPAVLKQSNHSASTLV